MGRLETLARLAAAALAALPLAALCGCSNSTETTAATTVVPTSIVVDPRSFLGDLPCSDEPGAVRSYVATITDDTVCDDAEKSCSQDSECCSNACILASGASGQGGSAQGTCAPKTQPFVLPSSPPTSCAHPVFFRYVVPGHVYSAEVDAFPVPPEALIPVGQVDNAFSGSRQMLDVNTRQPVSPRWTTTCGDTAETGAVAIVNANVNVDACAPLTDTGASITAIAVDPRVASTQTGCAGIGTIDVVPDDPALATALVACTGGPPALYTSGIVPGTSYGFTLRAHAAAGGAVTLGARCEAVSQTGITVTASCTPFAKEGNVRFDVGTLLPDVACAPGLFVQASLAPAGKGAGTIGSGVVACGPTVGVGPAPPGVYLGKLTATQDGKLVAQASCTATVTAGATAACQ